LTPQNGTGTPGNNKKHALRAFGVKKYRVAIDLFSFAVSQSRSNGASQRQKKSIFSLRSLRLCGEKENVRNGCRVLDSK